MADCRGGDGAGSDGVEIEKMMSIVIVAIIAAVIVAASKKTGSGATVSGATLAEMVNHEASDGGQARAETMRASGDFGYPYRASPNKGSRGGKKATTLVWHYTAGKSAEGAISWLCDKAAKASAHFVIGRKGEVTQLVPLDESAWHAGDSSVDNASSVGVELVNIGWVLKVGDGWTDQAGASVVPDLTPIQATLRWPDGTAKTAWWVPYTEAQYAAIVGLLANFGASKWAAVLSDQCGHADIARPTGRKFDPGPLFVWDRISSGTQRKRMRATKRTA